MKKRNRIRSRIENDYQRFQKEMLALPTKEVYDNAYKICCMEEIYNTLNKGDFQPHVGQKILKCKGSVLETIYQEWLCSSFTDMDCLQAIMADVLEAA